jgi:hypothetical protein
VAGIAVRWMGRKQEVNRWGIVTVFIVDWPR